MRKKDVLWILFFVLTNIATFTQEKFLLKGQITDSNHNSLSGVNLYIADLKIGAVSNNLGQYQLIIHEKGSYTLEISHIGFERQVIDCNITDGVNILNVKLKNTAYDIDGIIVSAQKREQQIMDVPLSISAISNQTISNLSVQGLDQFSDLVPGLNVRMQSNQRPSFVIRGLSSDEVSPNAQPRVSLFFNNVSISRASGGVLELYDMEQVEVVRGPQGSLFGRGAQIGAIHFLTKMPTNDFGGYISTGIGSYMQKEFQTAVNIPLIQNKLNTRIAAVYNTQDGYVENTFGGTLNGKNTKGVRFSARYLPSKSTKIDVVFNFQQDRAPGVAFISSLYPNTNGVKDVFAYEASLEKGKALKTNKDVLSYILNFKHYFNENLFLTAISSYQTNNSFERFDGDGSAAEAIDISETIDARQFSQELRLNYSISNNISGFTGFNYLQENVDQTYQFASNETHMVYLFLKMPEFMVGPDGQPISMPSFPFIPGLEFLEGTPLPTAHIEESISKAKNIATELFSDGTWKFAPKWNFNAGMRIVFDQSEVSYQAHFLEGLPSVLGILAGNSPNLFFKPTEIQKNSSNLKGLTGRFGISYELNPNSNLFISYSKGRRPNVIQYQSDGTSEILDAEIVYNIDLGFKSIMNDQFFFDIVLFYYTYNNFQTNAWDVNQNKYIIKDGGEATTYGLETSFQYHIFENLKLLGNYNYICARFDKKDRAGNMQEYSGNQFRLTPDHSFGLSLNYWILLNENIKFFINPLISGKSHFYFEDANTEGLDQSGYVLTNLSAGLNLKEPSLTFTLFSHNLLNKKYLISAGNSGSLFGIPTFVPAIPRTFGLKIKWDIR